MQINAVKATQHRFWGDFYTNNCIIGQSSDGENFTLIAFLVFENGKKSIGDIIIVLYFHEQNITTKLNCVRLFIVEDVSVF